MLTTVMCSRCGRAAVEGERCACCPQCGGRKSASALRCYACAWPGRPPKGSARQLLTEPTFALAVERKPRQIRFRVCCFSCGRATDVDVAPRQMARCDVCGGTMLVEIGDDD